MRPFAQCSACEVWFTVRQLLTDPIIEPLGLQFDSSAERLHFYFFHTSPSCMSAFKLPADELLQIVSESVPAQPLHRSPQCPEHCYQMDDEQICDRVCQFAPLRRLYHEMLDNRGMVPTEFEELLEAANDE